MDLTFDAALTPTSRSSLGKMISFRRKLLGLTREKLAALANINLKDVIRIEAGESPHIDDYILLIKGMGGDIYARWNS
ncbi:MAG TPA: helix-turn-helix transcriptional regulator [Dinghuibacter sp.]|uniref:helix-turn-helix domain-containing protein n=1 Tax=Dinghuibacter sp. TaxID=2024697 RepID=UPI002C1C4CE6|nr:helix-turn-helix transcriptional regulator [Dinghuibacter sp.]HTJ14431.1 helix-turn-helix transcriptional regulator [Dinghuibacter sp.]